MRIGYCKPEHTTEVAHITFKGQEKLVSSMPLHVSC